MEWLSLEELRYRAKPKQRVQCLDLLSRCVLTPRESMEMLLDTFSEDRMPQELSAIDAGLRMRIHALLTTHRPYKPQRLFLIGVGPSKEEAEAYRLTCKRKYEQLTALLGVAVEWNEERQEFL